MRKWLMTILMALAINGLADPVEITMSDGSRLRGDLKIMGAKPLIIVSEMTAGKRFTRQRKFNLADLSCIVHSIESQEMNRPWMYKEAGKTDKVYGEGTYPFVNFLTELHLVNGEVCRGHIISLPLVFEGNGSSKLFLNRQLKGEVGQSFADLIYPVRIDFKRPDLKRGDSIGGEIKGFGKVLQVSALDNRRGVIVPATLDGNVFNLDNPLPGSYDLFVLTETHVLFGLSGAGPDDSGGDVLSDGDLEAVRQVFPLADDFFKPDERWALMLRGNPAYAKLLVYGRRGDFHKQEKHAPGGGFVWHLDVWSWHRADGEWKIDKRYIAIRRKQPGVENVRRLMEFPALAGVTPGTKINLNREHGEDGGQFIRNLE